MVIDIAIVCILFWAGYMGYRKGFILQAAMLAALAIGILGGILFSDLMSSVIQRLFHTHSEYLPIISFAVTFVGIVIGIFFLATTVDKLLKVIALSLLNRIVGVFFNLAKYVLILSATLSIINSLDRQEPFIPRDIKAESKLYRPLSNVAPSIYPYLKFEVEKKLRKGENSSAQKSQVDGSATNL